MNGLRAAKKKVKQIVAALGGVLLFFMSLLTLIQVISRYIVRSPFTFSEELLRYLLIWVGLLGAIYCFADNKHLAVELLAQRYYSRSAAHKKRWRAYVLFVTLCFVALVMIVGGCLLVLNNWSRFSPISNIPFSVVYSILPISGVLIAFFLLCNFLLPEGD